jgi:hypothetical protein
MDTWRYSDSILSTRKTLYFLISNTLESLHLQLSCLCLTVLGSSASVFSTRSVISELHYAPVLIGERHGAR